MCQKLSDITGIPWGRDELIRSQLMGQSGIDVELIGKALELLPYSIEAKNQESWSVHQWMKQAKYNQKKGTDWVLVCKRNRESPVVILDAETFFNLIKKKLRYENPDLDGKC